jgi:lipoyl-dependent peroxiredoxin
MKRTAHATWDGRLRDGRGRFRTRSNALVDVPYSFSTRFGEEAGTSPEELIAAAHAGCFSMSLAFYLERAGLVPERIATDAELSFENQSGYWTVTGVHLRVRAQVPGAREDDFRSLAKEAEKGCLVSRLLKADITLEAGLEAETAAG